MAIDRNITININDTSPLANTAYVDAGKENKVYNKAQVNELVEDLREGTLGSVSPSQTLQQLNALPDGNYYASEAGTYAFGVTVPNGWQYRFNKAGTDWKVLTRVQIPMQDLTPLENRITENENKVDEFIENFAVEVDQEFIPTSENATSSKAVNDYLNDRVGSEIITSEEVEVFPIPKITGGVLNTDGRPNGGANQFWTGDLNIPEGAKKYKFTGSVTFYEAFLDKNNTIIVSRVVKSNVWQDVPTGAIKYRMGVQNTTVSINFSTDKIIWLISGVEAPIFGGNKYTRVDDVKELIDSQNRVTELEFDLSNLTHEVVPISKGQKVNDDGSISDDSNATYLNFYTPSNAIGCEFLFNKDYNLSFVKYNENGVGRIVYKTGLTNGSYKILKNTQLFRFTVQKSQTDKIDLLNSKIKLTVKGDELIFNLKDIYKTFDNLIGGAVDGNGNTISTGKRFQFIVPKGVESIKVNSVTNNNYTILSTINSTPTIIKYGVLNDKSGAVVIPENSNLFRMTITESDFNDIEIKVKLNPDFTTIKDIEDLNNDNISINALDSVINLRTQISNVSSFGNSNLNQWENFSDGSHLYVTIVDGHLKLKDDISTFGHQSKIRSRLFELSDKFTAIVKVNFLQLPTSFDTDNVDGVLDGYYELPVGQTGDDIVKNTGFSLAIQHPKSSLIIRPTFTLCKAIDYDTSGNLEIWRVLMPPSGNVGFQRVWSGNQLKINQDNVMQVDYRLHESKSYYELRIYGNGNLLVDYTPMWITTTNYGGAGSVVFQCKGYAESVCEYILKGFAIISEDKNKANFISNFINEKFI